MTDPMREPFEARLERVLSDDARDAVRPVDAMAIAATAMSHSSRTQRPIALLRLAIVLGLLAALLGGTLVVGSRLTKVLEPETPLSVDGSLLFQWIGEARSVAASTVDSDETRLSFGPTSIKATSRVGAMDRPLVEADAVTDGGILRITADADLDGCATGDDGEYPWSLSSGGTVLSIGPGFDECAVRADVLTGTWYRRHCPQAIEPGCLGDLVAGTYPSTNFATRLDAVGDWHPRLGALTYTLPDGWTNAHDWAAGLWLEPTPWHDEVLAAKGGVDDAGRDIGNGIYVLARPVAALQNSTCVTGVVDRTAGRTVDSLIDFVIQHPAIVPSSEGVRPIAIGPFEGRMVDITLDPTWEESCPGVAFPVAMLFTVDGGSQATGYGDMWSAAGVVDRIILLDLGGGRPVLIDISAPTQAEFDELLPDAMEIVKSFRFPYD